MEGGEDGEDDLADTLLGNMLESLALQHEYQVNHSQPRTMNYSGRPHSLCTGYQ